MLFPKKIDLYIYMILFLKFIMCYIYILFLQSDKYFIGKTEDSNFEIEDSPINDWLLKYYPLKILHIIENLYIFLMKINIP